MKHLKHFCLLNLPLLSFHVLRYPVFCSPLSLSEGFYLRATWNAELCFGLDLSGERSGQLFIMLSWLFRRIDKRRDYMPCCGRNEGKEIAIVRPLILSPCLPTLHFFLLLSLSSWSGGSSSIWSSCGLLGCGCHNVHTVSFLQWLPRQFNKQYSTNSAQWSAEWFDWSQTFAAYNLVFSSLSGNPPFYDETEEENTDLHNRIIFCRIVAGDFEFDSPYWDDISPAGALLHHTMAINN